MKKLFIILIGIFLLFTFFEIILQIKKYDQNIFQLKVCGEILGEYDENLFWRLKGVKPNFENESKITPLKIMCLTDSVSVMYEGKGYPEILQNIFLESIGEKNPIVFNGGVPGYTSYQGLKYFKNELLSYQPDVIVVCYGWNDHWQSENKLPDKLQKPSYHILYQKWKTLGFLTHQLLKFKQKHYQCVGPEKFHRVSLADYESNLKEIITIARENDILLILMTAPYLKALEEWEVTHQKYNQVVRQVATQEGIPLVDLVNTFKKREDLFIDPKFDKCHYNWKGSEIVAQALAEAILPRI